MNTRNSHHNRKTARPHCLGNIGGMLCVHPAILVFTRVPGLTHCKSDLTSRPSGRQRQTDESLGKVCPREWLPE